MGRMPSVAEVEEWHRDERERRAIEKATEDKDTEIKRLREALKDKEEIKKELEEIREVVKESKKLIKELREEYGAPEGE